MQKFFEYRLSHENWNDYYYLSLRFNNSTLYNLSNFNKLEGLKGISDNIEIINHFFDDSHKFLVVMDKNKVEELNELERVEYYDIYKLSKDDFKILRRLHGYSDSSITDMLAHQFYKKTRKTKNRRLLKITKIFFAKEYDRLREILESSFLGKILESIQSVKDFDDFISQFVESAEIFNLKFTRENYKIAWEYAILNSVADYEYEKEVLVKSDVFVIPKDSIIIFHKIPEQMYDDQRLFDIYLPILKKNFKIKFTNGRYDSQKLVYPIVRYLDKIKTFNQF